MSNFKPKWPAVTTKKDNEGIMEFVELSSRHVSKFVTFKNLSSLESPYINPTTEAKVKELVAEYGRDKNKKAYLLLDKEEIVGQLWLELDKKHNMCTVALLSTLAAYYGKGIGDILMQKAIDYALANEVYVLRLTASDDNSRAISFYRRHGFVKIKKVNKKSSEYHLYMAKPTAESPIISWLEW